MAREKRILFKSVSPSPIRVAVLSLIRNDDCAGILILIYVCDIGSSGILILIYVCDIGSSGFHPPLL